MTMYLQTIAIIITTMHKRSSADNCADFAPGPNYFHDGNIILAIQNCLDEDPIYGNCLGQNWGIGNIAYSLDKWCVSSVTDLSFAFGVNGAQFQGNLDKWDVSKVTTMWSMFASAEQFNSPLARWDTSSVTKMHSMFLGAHSFNQPIGGWNIDKVNDFAYMFRSSTRMNQDLTDWDVQASANTEGMFDWDMLSFRGCQEDGPPNECGQSTTTTTATTSTITTTTTTTTTISTTTITVTSTTASNCNPGEYRITAGNTCTACPPGQWSPGGTEDLCIAHHPCNASNQYALFSGSSTLPAVCLEENDNANCGEDYYRHDIILTVGNLTAPTDMSIGTVSVLHVSHPSADLLSHIKNALRAELNSTCTDNPDWIDSQSNSCDTYGDLCKDESFNLTDIKGLADSNGIDASVACCACFQQLHRTHPVDVLSTAINNSHWETAFNVHVCVESMPCSANGFRTLQDKTDTADNICEYCPLYDSSSPDSCAFDRPAGREHECTYPKYIFAEFRDMTSTHDCCLAPGMGNMVSNGSTWSWNASGNISGHDYDLQPFTANGNCLDEINQWATTSTTVTTTSYTTTTTTSTTITTSTITITYTGTRTATTTTPQSTKAVSEPEPQRATTTVSSHRAAEIIGISACALTWFCMVILIYIFLKSKRESPEKYDSSQKGIEMETLIPGTTAVDETAVDETALASFQVKF